jgi:hypothetical protein
MRVSGDALRGALNTFGLVARGRLGRATWSQATAQLSIAWAGITIDVDVVLATASAPYRVSVSAEVMKALVSGPPAGTEIDIHFDTAANTLRVGTLIVPAQPTAPPAPGQPPDSGLPVGATDRDVLIAARRGSTELGPDLDEVEARLSASLAQAAEALEWLGIDPAALARFVNTQLTDAPASATVPNAPRLAGTTTGRQLALGFDDA